ncbi:MAG: alpha/beta fold hydrolase [Bryobacteraceae bacterium]
MANKLKEIHLRTGVRLRYLDAGPTDGKPLILLHGYSDSSVSFYPILPLLPPEWRLIIPDQRGHGESERSAQGYSPVDLAADAVALLEQLGVAPVIAVGHSLGSFVARHMAVIAPERVARLVLVGSAATSRNGVVQSLEPAVQALADPVDVDFIRQFQASAVYRPIPSGIMDRAVAESRKLPARVWKSVLAGLLDPSLMTEFSRIQCPVSILWGDRDAIFGRAEQEELLRLIPGAAFHMFEDVGHTPHWEVPADFARRLLAEVR